MVAWVHLPAYLDAVEQEYWREYHRHQDLTQEHLTGRHATVEEAHPLVHYQAEVQMHYGVVQILDLRQQQIPHQQQLKSQLQASFLRV